MIDVYQVLLSMERRRIARGRIREQRNKAMMAMVWAGLSVGLVSVMLLQ
jgi:hypothetical protein